MTLEDRQQVEINRLWREKAGLREGVVTAVSPLEISIGGSDVSVRAVAADGVALEVDDRVSVLIQDQRIPLVVARPTDDPQAAGGGSTTPAAHAASHASAGSDPVTLAQSQVSGLTTALAAKAPLASPALTGNPTAPTQSASNDSTRLATTAFVKDQQVTDLTPPTTDVDFNGQEATNAADATTDQSLVTYQQMLSGDEAAASGYPPLSDVDYIVRSSFISAGWSETVAGTRSGSVITGNYNAELRISEEPWSFLGGASLGVVPDPGDEVLLIAQEDWGVGGDASDNGIYVVTATGDGSNPFVLTRRSDADTTGELQQFNRVRSRNGGLEYYLSSATPTINTDDQEWVEYRRVDLGLRSRLADSGLGVVVHGTTAGEDRPLGYDQVLWIGSATPTNRETDDPWLQTAAPQSWIEVGSGGSAPAFSNSWVNYGGSYGNIGFYKDPLGVVHLKGVMKTGTLNSAAFQLPAGYRPAANLEIATVSTDAVTWVRSHVTVGSSGNVVPRPGGNTWFSLDGISFRAA